MPSSTSTFTSLGSSSHHSLPLNAKLASLGQFSPFKTKPIDHHRPPRPTTFLTASEAYLRDRANLLSVILDCSGGLPETVQRTATGRDNESNLLGDMRDGCATIAGRVNGFPAAAPTATAAATTTSTTITTSQLGGYHLAASDIDPFIDGNFSDEIFRQVILSLPLNSDLPLQSAGVGAFRLIFTNELRRLVTKTTTFWIFLSPRFHLIWLPILLVRPNH